MNNLRFLFSMLLPAIFSLGCTPQKLAPFKAKKRYQSASIIITQISENTFIHTSFKQTNDFGRVPCNGLIVRNNNEAIVFDTPVNDSSAMALIGWITGTLHCTINAIIPTHFHDDCLGGLQAFHNQHIPSYGQHKTLALAAANGFTVPQNGFADSVRLPVGDAFIVARYLGEGHTADNVVGYFPAEDIMFGGCMIKELGANKGYLGDANLAAWSGTVEKVKKAFPHVRLVVPGHGAHGDSRLLDYTIQLFRKANP